MSVRGPANPASPWHQNTALRADPRPPRAAHLARAPAARQRSPYSHLLSALRVLAASECTREQLADLVQRRHAGEPVLVDSIIRQLTTRALLLQDGDRFGLSEAGAELAAAEGLALLRKGAARHPAPLVALAPGTRHSASAADLAASPRRPGSMRAAELPSRIGDHLHYRDGRITRMDGSEVQPARDPNADYQPTHDGRTRVRAVFGVD